MIAGLFGAKCQVVRIDADAVPADKPGLEIQEIPFGRRGGQHVAGVDAELMEDGGQFVHEGDVEIALRVFDDLGGLGDLDRGRAMDAGFHHRAIDLGDDIERARVLRRDDLGDRFEAVLLVARIDPLGRIADGEIAPARKARLSFQHRKTFFLDRARIDGRLVDDDVAALEHVADRIGC